jgi:hypothetical protein
MEGGMSVKLPHINDALVSLGFDQIADYDLEADSEGNPQISDWRSSSPQPTASEIEAAHAEWITEQAAQEYARKRKEEYPSIEECVHAILDDDLVALQEKRAAVKARYPK